MKYGTEQDNDKRQGAPSIYHLYSSLPTPAPESKALSTYKLMYPQTLSKGVKNKKELLQYTQLYTRLPALISTNKALSTNGPQTPGDRSPGNQRIALQTFKNGTIDTPSCPFRLKNGKDAHVQNPLSR